MYQGGKQREFLWSPKCLCVVASQKECVRCLERKGDDETAKGIKVYFRKMVGWRRGLFFSLSILSCAFLKHGGLRSSRERALVQHLNLEISKCIYIACRLYSGYVLECDPQNSLGMLSRIALLLQIRKRMQVGFSLIQPQNLLIIVFYQAQS